MGFVGGGVGEGGAEVGGGGGEGGRGKSKLFHFHSEKMLESGQIETL